MKGLLILPVILFCAAAPEKHAAARNSARPAAHENMVRIPAGSYAPFYRKKDSALIKVKSFWMDANAVTNEEYLEFIKANPSWAKSKVARLFADTNYLAHWENDFNIGRNYEKIRNSPVTHVSWFAANAYAKWKGKRLPSTAEWEYSACITGNPELTKKILQWYEKPNPDMLPNVRATEKNKFGLYDMYGLVWEWVNDFNSRVSDTDSRSGTVVDLGLFCSDGTLKTASKEDYASYMRYAFRFSLKGNYCINNLGFRCASDE